MLIRVKLYRIIYELFAYPKYGYYICTRIKDALSDHYKARRELI